MIRTHSLDSCFSQGRGWSDSKKQQKEKQLTRLCYLLGQLLPWESSSCILGMIYQPWGQSFAPLQIELDCFLSLWNLARGIHASLAIIIFQLGIDYPFLWNFGLLTFLDLCSPARAGLCPTIVLSIFYFLDKLVLSIYFFLAIFGPFNIDRKYLRNNYIVSTNWLEVKLPKHIS